MRNQEHVLVTLTSHAFQHKKSNEAGIKARHWLSEIRTEASIIRVEIQDKRKAQRESRKGMRGKKL